MPYIETLPQQMKPIQLFPGQSDSRLNEILDEARRLIDFDPSILTMIDADRDQMALEKKRIRLLDSRWEGERGGVALFGSESMEEEDSLTLGDGRPRLPAMVVLALSMVRGWLGGAKDVVVRTLLQESMSLESFLTEYGVGLPGMSTITENCNMIRRSTQDYILSALLRMARQEGLDHYQEIAFDSTAVHSQSSFPTDSSIISQLLRRARRGFILLGPHGLEVPISQGVEFKIEEVLRLEKEIALVGHGKGRNRKRKRLYKTLYKRATAARKYLMRALGRIAPKRDDLKEKPSLLARIDMIMSSIRDDLLDLEKAIAVSEERVTRNGRVPMEDKVLSTSDKSAAMIVKGGRETVLGYRPQIGRSTSGLITSFIVEEGNPTDSKQMAPIVMNHIANTAVTPQAVTFDGGYASAEGYESCLEIDGIEKVSVSGAKGRKLIPDDQYDSQEYQELRNFRSTVESTIGHLKASHEFGQCRRVGIEAVRHEMMEKILSFNLVEVTALRRKELAKTA